eukprot:TRINITY_DN11762_c0_g3_i1.p1 TRINITY_DN11762_c0_g3~~TRINITY_DN11762_c0_g3_i1.p1  ORF type:complete len:738 (+),score=108.77 TRINITY_DN11762_c0_g3_i1:53-2266(+)
MRVWCIGAALCVFTFSFLTFGGERSTLVTKPRGVVVLEGLIEKDDSNTWKALGMSSKEFDEEDSLSAFDEESSDEIKSLSNSNPLASELIDLETFVPLIAGSREFAENFSGCIHIQHYSCPSYGWTSASSDLRYILLGGANRHVNFKLVPVSESETETLYFLRHCTPDESSPSSRYLAAERDVYVKEQTSGDAQKFKIGMSSSLVNGLGFYIATNEDTPSYIVDRGGRVGISLKPNQTDNKGTWTLLPPKLPDFIHFLEAIPRFTSVKGKAINGCIKKYKGCCFPKRFSPKLRKPAADERPVIAPIITSSKNTLPSRYEVLENWMFHKSLKPVITTDCYMPTMLERFTKNRPAAWLVGPTGPSIKGHAEVVLRVTLAVHWAVHNMEVEWFFVCDDDTLVFPENLFWVAAHFEKPKDVPYYVGHTTEWHKKSRYHGDMAFGGGGALLSAAIQKEWAAKWNNMPSNAISWLDSGNWNHAGGDGSVCRLATWLLEESHGPNYGFYAETRGFHQFDLIGSDHILKDVSKTCPRCPPIFDQIGHWIDSAVSERPVVTLHHLGGIRHGSVFPNLDGAQTMLRLYKGYFACHHHMFLRRVCAPNPVGNFTFCINFGRSVQIYSSNILPEEAMVVLKYWDYRGRQNPELLSKLMITSGPWDGHIDTAYFEESDSQNRQLYRPTDETPAPTPVRKGTEMFVKEISVSVELDKGTAEAVFTMPDDSTSSAKVNIAHLLTPQISISEG